MKKITVFLLDAEAQALEELAKVEGRSAEVQAHEIIVDDLKKRGIIKSDTPVNEAKNKKYILLED